MEGNKRVKKIGMIVVQSEMKLGIIFRLLCDKQNGRGENDEYSWTRSMTIVKKEAVDGRERRCEE